MTTETMENLESARVHRYRQAEKALWDHYGLEPTERFIDVASPPVRLRVLEVGSGEPILFIPGTGGTGPYWGPLIRELQGYRCLMLDRPGWGLSSPLDYSKYEYKAVTASVLQAALDALGVARAHLVGNSIGNVWALRLAAAKPSRVGRVVLMGGGPVLSEIRVPLFIRLLASPIGALLVRLPQKPGIMRSQLRQMGHGPSLDAGRMDGFVEWRVAMMRDTESLHNERAMVRAIVSWRDGWRPGLTFEEGELREITQPTLQVYGTADPVGTVDIWKRAVGLLPQGELHIVNAGGHEPWLEDPSGVAGRVRRFLME